MEVIKTRRDVKRPKLSLNFSYTGDYDYTEDDEGWLLELKSSGTLTLKTAALIDLFIANSGSPGCYASEYNATWYPTALIYGGHPGAAANYYRELHLAGDYPVVIGEGTSGLESINYVYGDCNPSTAFGYTPTNGKNDSERVRYSAFGTTVVPFDDADFQTKYKLLGEGGHGLNQYTYDNETDKSYYLTTGYGVYATYGGGNGSMSKTARGSNAVANTGSGGGGGWWEGNNENIGSFTYGGDGGSGVVFLRNAR